MNATVPSRVMRCGGTMERLRADDVPRPDRLRARRERREDNAPGRLVHVRVFRSCPGGLRCLSFVDRRLRPGRKADDVAVWGPARQRRRIYLMV